MKELADIVAAWETICADGGEAVLATVVQVAGSTYRRPGARMLLTPEGRLAGSVSGGCLEGELVKKARWHTRTGPALVTYDSMDADDDVVWGFGLGCNGVVRVLLERVTPTSPGPLDLLRVCLRERRAGVSATVIGGAAPAGQRLLLLPDGTAHSTLADAGLDAAVREDARRVLAASQSRTETYALPGGATEVFLEAVLPPLPLIIFGAGHDVAPLVRLAGEIGRHVTVVDVRAMRARPERFPQADRVLACAPHEIAAQVTLDARTAAVVMTHNYSDDRRVLEVLLRSPVGYIGQLGPRVRTERLLAEIGDDGLEIGAAQRARLHGPVGLDIGADSPEEIALSVLAEIQAVQAGRSGGSLRERRTPLHPHPLPPPKEAPTEAAACSLTDQ